MATAKIASGIEQQTQQQPWQQHVQSPTCPAQVQGTDPWSGHRSTTSGLGTVAVRNIAEVIGLEW